MKIAPPTRAPEHHVRASARRSARAGAPRRRTPPAATSTPSATKTPWVGHRHAEQRGQRRVHAAQHGTRTRGSARVRPTAGVVDRGVSRRDARARIRGRSSSLTRSTTWKWPTAQKARRRSDESADGDDRRAHRVPTCVRPGVPRLLLERREEALGPVELARPHPQPEQHRRNGQRAGQHGQGDPEDDEQQAGDEDADPPGLGQPGLLRMSSRQLCLGTAVARPRPSVQSGQPASWRVSGVRVRVDMLGSVPKVCQAHSSSLAQRLLRPTQVSRGGTGIRETVRERCRREETVMKRGFGGILGVIVVIWLVIGAFAAFQRGLLR